jgi:hypothetical protein
MDKIIEYRYGDHNSEIVSLISSNNLHKQAEYSDELKEYVSFLKKKVDKTYALVNALSAGEHYGCNRNGDFFPEDVLQRYHKTFEALGHVYKHHVNKDPRRSFGKVVFSHYNPNMHRVELIIELDNTRAADIIEDIEKDVTNVRASMACRVPFDVCLSIDTQIITKDNTKHLKDVEVNDAVLTHTGEFKTVLAKSERVIDSYFSIAPFGDYKSLDCSSTHPFQIAKKEQFIEGNKEVIRRSSLKTELPELLWEEAGNLRVGDYLVFKKTKETTEQLLNKHQARIFGYYLAEGFIIKQRPGRKKDGFLYDNGVAFSFNLNEKETFVEDLTNSLTELGYTYKLYEFPEKNEIRVNCYDKSRELINLLKTYGGEYSKTKFIHPLIFSQSEEIKLEILGTAINGDGSQDHNKQEGVIRYNTVSEQLARGIRRLALECGIVASIHHQSQVETTFGVSDVYTVHIPASQSEKLVKYSEKITKYDKSVGSRFFDFDDFILIPILKVEEVNETLIVQNLQVEEDESYQALDYVTHNCSICGNKARKLSEYCSHLKEKMGRILGDGRRVYAVNTMPKFFDISVVTIPADRTAGFISKVASDSSTNTVDVNEYIPSAKVAEDLSKESDLESSADIKKKIDVELKALSPDPNKLILKTQGNITKDKLVKLAEYPLNEVLSTMIGLRIMPKKEDFMKLALYSLGHNEFAEDVATSDYSFDAEKAIEPSDVNCDNFNVKIAELLKEDVPQLSLTKPYIIARAFEKVAETSQPCQNFSTVLEKYGYDNSDEARSEWPKQVTKQPSKIQEIFLGTEEPPLLSPKQNPLIPMAVLGGLYTGYAKLFTKAFDKGGVTGLLGKYPWIAPLLIGAGTVGSLKLQDLYFKKTASAGKLIPAMIFAGLPASYLYAGIQEAKVRKGQPVSKLQNFVRKHPFLSTLIATGATGAGINLIKRASVISQMDEGSINSIYEDLIKES